MAQIFGVAYGVGKSACDRLAAEMADELKAHQVASIALWPGIVGTEHIQAMVSENAQQPQPNPALTAMASRFNWESPLLTGRVIAALAADNQRMARSGKVQIVAELPAHSRLVDGNGHRPASLRSLRFFLPTALPGLRRHAAWIPDLRPLMGTAAQRPALAADLTPVIHSVPNPHTKAVQPLFDTHPHRKGATPRSV